MDTTATAKPDTQQVEVTTASGSRSYLYYEATPQRARQLASAYLAAVCWQGATVTNVKDA